MAASAGQPAVRATSFGASLDYSYLASVPEEQNLFLARRFNTISGGMRVTTTLTHRIGFRGGLAGGVYKRVPAGPRGLFEFPDIEFVTVNAEPFWRDPERGTVGLSYRYRGESVEGREDEASSHRVRLGGALYLDRFTASVSASYRRILVEQRILTLTGPFTFGSVPLETRSNEYAISADAGAYVCDALSVWLGVSWSTVDAMTTPAVFDRRLPNSSTVQGSAFVEWLPPLGKQRFVSLVLRGNVGGEVSRPSPYGRFLYGLGAGVRVSFPGVESLLELDRYYR